MTRVAVVPPPKPAPWRCPRCGNLLAKVHLAPGSVIETKCKKCGSIVTKEAA